MKNLPNPYIYGSENLILDFLYAYAPFYIEISLILDIYSVVQEIFI